MSDALILTRAVHLFATILLTGAVVFRVLVAEPAFRSTGESLLARLRFVLRRIIAVNLGVAVVSGAAWLALLVASLGDASMAEFGERASIFLTQTQFGITALLRLALALLLAAALLLRYALQAGRPDPAALTDVLRRFSNLGMLAVGTLVASGAVNTVFSVGSVDALVASDYGRLLLLKIALFAGMAALAAINRLRWMPDLVAATTDMTRPIARIHVNALCEIALGIAIVLLVAWLGAMAPAMPPAHLH